MLLSSLLKTAASNAVVYEKLANVVDHCWMVTPDHHLDDRLSLSHVNRRRRPHINAVNNTHWWMARSRISGHLFTTWPLNISPPKEEKTCPDDRYAVMQTFTPIGVTCAAIKNYSRWYIRQQRCVCVVVCNKGKLMSLIGLYVRSSPAVQWSASRIVSCHSASTFYQRPRK